MIQTPQFPILARQTEDAPHPMLKQLEQHWHSLRVNGTIPARDDVDPGIIGSALPWTFVLQRVAPGVARMRVAGQQLHDLLGMDPRGMPISAFFGADERSTFAVHLEMAFSDPAIVALPLFAPATLLRKQVTGQILLMPLVDNQGDVSRVLGALITDGPLGSRKRRLMIDDTKPTRYEPINMMPIPALQPTEKPNAGGRSALKLVVNNG
ncbi:MAG: PAS domain-containing protein [Yoonia sp.]|nr:PAS domain-containing protein [Yoonia sp.]